MTELGETQRFFAGAVLQPVSVAHQPGVPLVAARFVAGNDRLAPTDQLEIYREQFWLRHVGALEEDFATLVRLLGHDDFHRLVERYLEAHPPAAFSLRDLGAELPGFLTREAPYRDDALLADCARLEWAFVDAFDAEDATPVDPSTIAAIPEDAWPSVRLSLHPALCRLSLSHPAHVYRAAVKAGEEPARPDPKPACVAVYRGPETLQYVEIEPLAFELLERLGRGEALGAACEAVAASAPGSAAELEEKVGSWFQFWTAAGWITGLSSP